MKILRFFVILVLIAVTAMYCFSTFFLQVDGSNVGPVIRCDTDHLNISVTDDESVLLQGVTASDQQDGDLTSHILISGISKMVEKQVKVTYVVFDSDNNMASLTRTVSYTDYVSPRFQILEPLNYVKSESIALLDRLKVVDVIDGDITANVRISYMSDTDQSDVSTIDLQITNSLGDTSRITVPVVRQSIAPKGQILLDSYLLYLKQGDTFRPREHLTDVTLENVEDAMASVKIFGTVDTSTPGCYYVYYSYTRDGHDLKTVLTVIVE